MSESHKENQPAMSPEADARLAAIAAKASRGFGQESRAELRSHLDDLYWKYRSPSSSLPEGEVLSRAEKDFGDPRKVRAMLLRTHRPGCTPIDPAFWHRLCLLIICSSSLQMMLFAFPGLSDFGRARSVVGDSILAVAGPFALWVLGWITIDRADHLHRRLMSLASGVMVLCALGVRYEQSVGVWGDTWLFVAGTVLICSIGRQFSRPAKDGPHRLVWMFAAAGAAVAIYGLATDGVFKEGNWAIQWLVERQDAVLPDRGGNGLAIAEVLLVFGAWPFVWIIWCQPAIDTRCFKLAAIAAAGWLVCSAARMCSFAIFFCWPGDWGTASVPPDLFHDYLRFGLLHDLIYASAALLAFLLLGTLRRLARPVFA